MWFRSRPSSIGSFVILTSIAVLVTFLATQVIPLPSRSSYAFAAYDQPVTWADMSALDLKPILRSEYASSGNLYDPLIPESAYDLVLRDADNRLSKDFHVPRDLAPLVSFWLGVYTKFTTQQSVIFDANHPEIVYEILDFRELAQTARNAVVYEIVSHKRLHAALAAYRRAFQHLGRNPHPAHPTREEQIILSRIQLVHHKHKFSEYARNLRTQAGQRDNIIKGLLAAETFFPKMETLFSRVGVPPELTRLSLVESSFDLSAKSRVGAAGVWQFMRPSGREYLLIDEKKQIDERLSPLKSTVAAAKLLKRNYRMFKNWPLAVTAYNHGYSGLRSLMGVKAEDRRVAQLLSPCSRRSRLGWASRNYYGEFLAVLHAEAYHHLFYGEPPAPSPRPIVFAQASPHKTALEMAKEAGVSVQEFEFFNPDVRNLRRELPKGFWIALPGTQDDFVGLTTERHYRAARVVSRSSRAT